MSGPGERLVETPLGRARVLEKGAGTPVGFLAGLGGLPAWLPVLDRLAQRHRVVVPSLPGFPGGADYEPLDGILDWIMAVGDLAEAAGLAGAPLIGASIGATLAAELAAVRPGAVERLMLLAPFGLCDEAEPVADVFAQRPGTQAALLNKDEAAWTSFAARPDGVDEMDWNVMALRADMAAAKLLWPLGDTGLAKRLYRIDVPALLVWGADDRAVPPSYAQRFAEAIGTSPEIVIVPGAGHRVEFDAPDEVAAAITDFLR